MAKRKKKPNRHAFRFKMPNGKIMTVWAAVIHAKSHVYLPLKAAHVRASIEAGGVGNTQTCSMAVCAARESSCFPHPVEGTIDWFYSRAYVVSAVNKDGLPSKCYEYMHYDKIAQLNDTRGGQRKLLNQLDADGDRIIHLLPVDRAMKRKRSAPDKPRGNQDGSRTRVTARGAALRFAVAQAGGVSA